MRPETPEDKKLREGIRIRLTRKEKELLTERCRKEGSWTISDFGRAKLLRNREIRWIEVSLIMDVILNTLLKELNTTFNMGAPSSIE